MHCRRRERCSNFWHRVRMLASHSWERHTILTDCCTVPCRISIKVFGSSSWKAGTHLKVLCKHSDKVLRAEVANFPKGNKALAGS